MHSELPDAFRQHAMPKIFRARIVVARPAQDETTSPVGTAKVCCIHTLAPELLGHRELLEDPLECVAKARSSAKGLKERCERKVLDPYLA